MKSSNPPPPPQNLRGSFDATDETEGDISHYLDTEKPRSSAQRDVWSEIVNMFNVMWSCELSVV